MLVEVTFLFNIYVMDVRI